jgi:hypothetical protein
MSDQDRKNNPGFTNSGHGSGGSAAQDAKDKAMSDAKDVKDKVASEAGNLKDQVVDEAKRVKDEAQQQVSSVVSENKTRAADEVGSVAQAFRETGKRLREEDHGAVAQYADQFGDQVERVAGYLRDKDMGAMIGDLENMARRQPALFIGGAVAVGLLASRFLKSSASSMSRGGSYGGGYGGDYRGDYRGDRYDARNSLRNETGGQTDESKEG